MQGYTSMLVMMDASDAAEGSLDQHVLAHVRAYSDGSFHMRPGFSEPGLPHRFEDEQGAHPQSSTLLISSHIGEGQQHRRPAMAQ